MLTYFITVFVDTCMRLWKTKHPWKRFQNFRQSCLLLTDWIEIHQSQPLVWPSDFLSTMLAGCDWWILIWSVDNMHDWRKFWKRFHGCFVFESHVSTKTVVSPFLCIRKFGINVWETVGFWSVFGRLPDNQGELKKMVFTGGMGIVNTPGCIVEISYKTC